jgi:hypothetical protein
LRFSRYSPIILFLGGYGVVPSAAGKSKSRKLWLLLPVAAIGYLGWRTYSDEQLLHTYQKQTVFDEGRELSQVITEIKKQIAVEQKTTAGANLADTWKIHDIDLELSFTVKQERTSEGQAETKLIAVTDTRNISAERVQRVTFHLLPVTQNFSPVGPTGITTPPPPNHGKAHP